MTRNDIDNVTSVGVWCANYSDPVMRLGGTSSVDNNDIVGGGWAIYCNAYSEPLLGMSYKNKGNNKICGNTYDFWAQADCDKVFAEYKYWCEVPPTSSQIVHLKGSQYIDYEPYLSGDPKLAPDFTPLTSKSSRSGDDPEWYNRMGRLLFEEEKYEEAIFYLEYVIDNYPDSDVASHSLDHLASCYQAMDREDELFG